MQRRFTVLRLIGTIWKIVAWLVLVVGLLSSLALLLTSLLGGGLLNQVLGQLGEQGRAFAWAPWVFSAAGGIVGAILSLFITVTYFLAMYAVGDLIYLLLAIEQNTRETMVVVRGQAGSPYQPIAAQPMPTPPPAADPPPQPPQT